MLVAFLEAKVFSRAHEKVVEQQGRPCGQAFKGVLCPEHGPGQNRSCALAFPRRIFAGLDHAALFRLEPTCTNCKDGELQLENKT